MHDFQSRVVYGPSTLRDGGGVLGRPLDTFLLGSHNLMVTALGSSCVKWPLCKWEVLAVCVLTAAALPLPESESSPQRLATATLHLHLHCNCMQYIV